MKNYIQNIIASVLVFVTNKRITWVALPAVFLVIFFFFPKTVFWVGMNCIIITVFIMNNIHFFKPWAIEKWKKITSKI